MKRARFTKEQIIGVLKEQEAGAEVDYGLRPEQSYRVRPMPLGMTDEIMVERWRMAASLPDDRADFKR